MSDPIAFFLPMPEFTWRETKKTHAGRCPKRGHCTETRHGGDKPETKGNRKKVTMIGGHASIRESNRAVAAEEAVCAALRKREERPEAPMANDVVFDVVFTFAPPNGWPAWKKEAALAGAIRPTSANCGDRDNCHKSIADALAGAGYIADDALITDGVVAKQYGPAPGYWIGLRELQPTPKTAKEWRARR